jgi:glucosamine--fructose-6-phosphate aminotransferase (isomerizing)
MCGIVGYIGEREAVPLIVEGLGKLAYRGYDSAGVVVRNNGALDSVKAEGKLEHLVAKLAEQTISGPYGLGHTRWATHGAPSERNAHPILDARGRVALIHNGIIENFLQLKKRLQAEGWEFSTDTDTEVIANLISYYLTDDLAEAVRLATDELQGMYAIAVVSTVSEKAEIIAARQGPPLVFGVGEDEYFLASDPAALLSYTRRVVFLENGDIGRISDDGIEIRDHHNRPADRQVVKLTWDPIQAEKGGFKHFMLKEIHEQPQAVQDTFGGRVDFESTQVFFDSLNITPDEASQIERVQLLACGTSWHAGLIGKFLIEQLVRIPVDVDYGSEYRYRDPVVDDRVLALGISQSGETADTLAAMEAAKQGGASLFAICNVPGSEATRISQGVIYTHAGPEIGVASTKAFTTQLVAMYLFALYLRQQRGMKLEASFLEGLAHLPVAINQILKSEKEIEELARRYFRRDDFLFLGRGINYPIALEGALKLKEISYSHAEGYPAGEMKHGPIALIDEDFPVVAIATGDTVFEKVCSNMEQVRARDGAVIAVTDHDPERLEGIVDDVISVPRVDDLLQPVVNVIPLQLFAYYVAVRRGADVDQPRNLAKSVTVE